MGNGSRPKSGTDRKIQVNTRKAEPQSTESVRSGGGEGGSSGGGGSSKPECWEFTLLDLQNAAKQAESGMEVYGLIQRSRVLVANRKLGPLGFAPSGATERMIQAASRRARELNGHIISVSKTGDRIRARLCLT